MIDSSATTQPEQAPENTAGERKCHSIDPYCTWPDCGCIKAGERARYRRYLEGIRNELAALIPDPSAVTVKSWPVANEADALCLMSAWLLVTGSLDDPWLAGEY